MDFRLSDEQELLRKSVREFAETEMRPHIMEWDNAQHFPKVLLPKLAELGLMGIQFPEAMGGAGMSAVDYCICIEELARVDPSVSLSVAAHNGLGAAWLKDQGRRMTLESAMAKLYSSEIAVRASEDCVQLHGGYGFVKDYPAEKYFRDVKLLTIGEGTSEVQRLVIARQLLAA